MKQNGKQRLFEVIGRLDNTFKPKLNEEYSEWNSLIQLKDNEGFTRDELKLILTSIYQSVYREDKQKMLELLRFFNLADDFI